MLKTYCETKYYSEFNSDNLLLEIQEKVTPNIVQIEKEFQFIFYKILHTEPCSYWDRGVYEQTLNILEGMYKNSAEKLYIDENTLSYLLMGYNAYESLVETILDLRNFNLSTEVKTRLYRLPTYTAIIESCISNFLRVILTLTGQSIGKDYASQDTLGKLVNAANANGYSEITKNINVNLRNAINHGKVLIHKDVIDKIHIFYTENHKAKSEQFSPYEIDNFIDKAFDAASGIKVINLML